VLRAGVYEMANLAFQKTDSLLIHKIIKGEKLATDQATGTVTIEGSVYSMDSPAVRAKVMGTLRSAFFQDTVKMKMSDLLELYQLRTRRSIYLQCLMVKSR
jgi:hypothetical protein